MVEGVEEGGIDDDGVGWIEHAYFVFKSVKIDTSLSAHAGINHGKERCGDIDIFDASLEGAGSKSAQVCDHAASKIDKQGMACGTAIAHGFPHLSKRIQCLARISGTNDYRLGMTQAGKMLHHRETLLVCSLVGQQKKLVMRYMLYGVCQCLCYVCRNNNVICHKPLNLGQRYEQTSEKYEGYFNIFHSKCQLSSQFIAKIQKS